MKLIIAGSRNLKLEPGFIEGLLKTFNILDSVKEVVSGGADGVDWHGEEFSIDFLCKDAKMFPADWTQGPIAGPMRNKRMAEYADALLLIWSGASPGSSSMKAEMLKLKKPIYEVIIRSIG